MILLDLTHTSHTAARTGIQRVARSLYAELGAPGPAAGVCFDPHLGAWRELEGDELACARGVLPAGGKRGARWSLGQRLRGRTRRWLGRAPELPAADRLVVPEIFSPAVAARFPELFARVAGPRVAFCCDLIPLTHPEHTPAKTVGRFPAYLQELLQFDGIAAISQTTADHLAAYWRWLGAKHPPPVRAFTLGAPVRVPAKPVPPPGAAPRVLCVGSIEGRKNHLALLDAAESLWAAGLNFELQLVGLPRPETAAKAIARIGQLRANGRPLLFSGALDETALDRAWAACAFSVYPSEIEGFGLPVVESLAHGKPCVCAARGATGELVAGGGVVGVAPADAANLAAALRGLLTGPAELARLTAEAGRRPLATWRDTARELVAWMDALPLRR